MKRYIIQLDNQYVKWISWIGGITPNNPFLTDFDSAMIVSEEYLNCKIERAGLSRKELIKQKYPEVKFVEVKVVIVGEE
ncbi:hypothetical protein [Bacillus sp. NPDC094106]|uniref:hypothetical protein n=1 Tax=Bacillus sp. NPDC094106 TaxID=3363949 RepID=UPI003802C7E6